MLRNGHIRAARCCALCALATLPVLFHGGSAAAAEPGEPSSAAAFSADEVVRAKPKELAKVDVAERLGETMPADLAFVTDAGTHVTMGAMFESGLPVIVSFNYSNCPMLCSLQLNALTVAMGKIGFRLGKHFHVLTVVLEPTETPATATETKLSYIRQLPDSHRGNAIEGWTFLTGPESSIRAAAAAVGLSYEYVESRGEYAHPAVLAFLSPGGTITRYLYGIDYEPDLLSQSIMSAGLGKKEESVGFLLACFHFNPRANDKSGMAVGAMRYGAFGFLLLFAGALALWNFSRRRKTRKESLSS